MPVPFLSPDACHACKGEDLQCDRSFPLCINCHRNSKPCTYDPFTIDPTQLGVWPGPSPIPLAVPGPSGGSNVATGGLQAPTYLPYYDMSWMNHVDPQQGQQQHQQQQHFLAALLAMQQQQQQVQQQQTIPGKPPALQGPPPMAFAPQMFDPAWVAALAHAQAFAFSQGHMAQVGQQGSATETTNATTAVTPGVAEEPPQSEDGEEPEEEGDPDAEMVETPEQNVEDAEGENEDEDMDSGMDMVDFTQHP